MLRSLRAGAVTGVLAGLAIDCGGLGSSCVEGREGCPCTVQGTCEQGLQCDDSECARPGGSSDTGGTAATSNGPTTTMSMATSSDDDPTAADASETGPAIPCEGSDLRIVTFNVQAVGEQGSEEWNALAAVLARLSPDIACIEELGDFETGDLGALAEALGWGPPIQADPSPGIGGELRNACLGPRTMNRIASYTASDVSPDGGANDLSRDVLAVRVDLDDGCHANVLAIHAKSGEEPVDHFRRMVDYVRATQAVDTVRALYPDEGVILMGDFNENPEDESIGLEFPSVPAGLPPSYALGSDITFPIDYEPFGVFMGAALTRLEPTGEDSTRKSTWGVIDSDGFRLDYVWLDGIELEQAIVYDACFDDGVDADPPGAWLALTGDPLPCPTSRDASDHLPIVADLRVPASP